MLIILLNVNYTSVDLLSKKCFLGSSTKVFHMQHLVIINQ